MFPNSERGVCPINYAAPPSSQIIWRTHPAFVWKKRSLWRVALVICIMGTDIILQKRLGSDVPFCHHLGSVGGFFFWVQRMQEINWRWWWCQQWWVLITIFWPNACLEILLILTDFRLKLFMSVDFHIRRQFMSANFQDEARLCQSIPTRGKC